MFAIALIVNLMMFYFITYFKICFVFSMIEGRWFQFWNQIWYGKPLS